MKLSKFKQECQMYGGNPGIFKNLLYHAMDRELICPEDLANRLQMSVSTIYRWVDGTIIPHEHIRRCAVAELLKGLK